MNPNLIGPVIGGIIFFFVQLGTNMGDQSGIIRLASLLIAAVAGTVAGGIVQAAIVPKSK